MFRDQVYPSASAALEAYILEYEGVTPESSFTKSQRPTTDVDTLLSSMPGNVPVPYVEAQVACFQK